MASPGDDGKLSFEWDIRPLFRRRTATRCWRPLICSITGMSWSVPMTSSGALRSGQMPCDGAWPESQVETLQQWIDAGMPA